MPPRRRSCPRCPSCRRGPRCPSCPRCRSCRRAPWCRPCHPPARERDLVDPEVEAGARLERDAHELARVEGGAGAALLALHAAPRDRDLLPVAGQRRRGRAVDVPAGAGARAAAIRRNERALWELDAQRAAALGPEGHAVVGARVVRLALHRLGRRRGVVEIEADAAERVVAAGHVHGVRGAVHAAARREEAGADRRLDVAAGGLAERVPRPLAAVRHDDAGVAVVHVVDHVGGRDHAAGAGVARAAGRAGCDARAAADARAAGRARRRADGACASGCSRAARSSRRCPTSRRSGPLPAAPLPVPLPVPWLPLPAVPVMMLPVGWHASDSEAASETASKPMNSLFDIRHL